MEEKREVGEGERGKERERDEGEGGREGGKGDYDKISSTAAYSNIKHYQIYYRTHQHTHIQ